MKTLPTQRPVATAPASATEFAFTADDFRRIAELVHVETGIRMPEYKSAMVYSRLAKRLRVLGLRNFKDYCALVLDRPDLDERQRMLAALTTNMTSFFREPHHFDHLRNVLLPALVERALRGGRVRIWSAGCSSGEEAYSIALSVLQVLPEAERYDVRILATDINPDVVERGRQGIYEDRVMAPVPEAARRQWFAPGQQAGRPACQAGAELKRLVVFKELNLMGEWPMKGRFDAIFCRNVTIYFDVATRDRVWERLADCLVPGGCLYIGHSERLHDAVADRLCSEAFTTFRLPVEARR